MIAVCDPIMEERMPRQAMRKRWNAAGLLALSRRCLERIEDGTSVRTYRLVDCLMSAVVMFGLKSPSLLQLGREVRLDGRVRGNLRRLAVSGGSGAVRHADADASGPGSGACLAPGLPAAVPRTAARQGAEAVCGVRPPLSVVAGRHGLFCIGSRALQVLLGAASPQRHGHLSPSDAGWCDRASGLSGL